MPIEVRYGADLSPWAALLATRNDVQQADREREDALRLGQLGMQASEIGLRAAAQSQQGRLAQAQLQQRGAEADADRQMRYDLAGMQDERTLQALQLRGQQDQQQLQQQQSFQERLQSIRHTQAVDLMSGRQQQQMERDRQRLEAQAALQEYADDQRMNRLHERYTGPQNQLMAQLRTSRGEVQQGMARGAYPPGVGEAYLQQIDRRILGLRDAALPRASAGLIPPGQGGAPSPFGGQGAPQAPEGMLPTNVPGEFIDQNNPTIRRRYNQRTGQFDSVQDHSMPDFQRLLNETISQVVPTGVAMTPDHQRQIQEQLQFRLRTLQNSTATFNQLNQQEREVQGALTDANPPPSQLTPQQESQFDWLEQEIAQRNETDHRLGSLQLYHDMARRYGLQGPTDPQQLQLFTQLRQVFNQAMESSSTAWERNVRQGGRYADLAYRSAEALRQERRQRALRTLGAGETPPAQNENARFNNLINQMLGFPQPGPGRPGSHPGAQPGAQRPNAASMANAPSSVTLQEATRLRDVAVNAWNELGIPARAATRFSLGSLADMLDRAVSEGRGLTVEERRQYEQYLSAINRAHGAFSGINLIPPDIADNLRLQLPGSPPSDVNLGRR